MALILDEVNYGHISNQNGSIHLLNESDNLIQVVIEDTHLFVSPNDAIDLMVAIRVAVAKWHEDYPVQSYGLPIE